MQYHLAITLEPNQTFDSFYCHSSYTNALVNQIKQQTSPTILIGSTGTGKTHLLQAACHHHSKQWLYLDGKKIKNINPNLIENLENQFICLDNLEQICRYKSWQDALFKLFLLNHNHILCSASDAIILSDRKDLQSRIQAMLTLKLPTLDENDQAKALQHKMQRKGFPLPINLIQWMQKNLPRDNSYLTRFIDQLESESCRRKKKPSIHLAKELMTTF